MIDDAEFLKAIENARQYGYFDGLHLRGDAGLNDFDEGLEREAYLAGYHTGFAERRRVNTPESVEDRASRTLTVWGAHRTAPPTIEAPTSSWRQKEAYQ